MKRFLFFLLFSLTLCLTTSAQYGRSNVSRTQATPKTNIKVSGTSPRTRTTTTSSAYGSGFRSLQNTANKYSNSSQRQTTSGVFNSSNSRTNTSSYKSDDDEQESDVKVNCYACKGSGKCRVEGIGSMPLHCGGSGKCPRCNGKGKSSTKCAKCKGDGCDKCDDSGYVDCPSCEGSGDCSNCDGSGVCPKCGGSGKI